MKITYLEHSGFVVEDKEYVLIFDWYKGGLPLFDADKKIFVFASHSHYDHYNDGIFTLKEQYTNVNYILSEDIVTEEPNAEIMYVTANREYQVENLKIQTLHSTDEGVAYVVCVNEKTIYHAGDLNWWHWEDETELYNENMKKDYQREIDKLKNLEIDIAFVPLDPRQENQDFWGIDYFMKHTHTKHVFPMHMWGQYDEYDRLMNNPEAASYKERVMKISGPGQVFRIDDEGI